MNDWHWEWTLVGVRKKTANKVVVGHRGLGGLLGPCWLMTIKQEGLRVLLFLLLHPALHGR